MFSHLPREEKRRFSEAGMQKHQFGARFCYLEDLKARWENPARSPVMLQPPGAVSSQAEQLSA